MDKIATEREVGRHDELVDRKKAELEKKQGAVLLSPGRKLTDVAAELKAHAIEVEPIPAKTVDTRSAQSKLKDFDRSYNVKQKEADLAAILTHFNNDPEAPLFVEDIQREDTSDEFNKKETITVTFKDATGVKHTFKVDYPKLIDERFMFLNNGKKSLAKQIVPLPIVKSKADTVQVTSNYAKMFVIRYGAKFDPSVARFQKYIRAEAGELARKKVGIVAGVNSSSNSGYDNTLEYDEISAFLSELSAGPLVFLFNRRASIDRIREATGVDLDRGELLDGDEVAVGYSTSPKGVIVVDPSTNEVSLRPVAAGKQEEKLGDSIVQAMVGAIAAATGEENVPSDVFAHAAGSRFAYSRVTVLNQRVPLVLLLGFKDGLSPILKRYEVDFEFSSGRKVLSPEQKATTNVVRFADGYLCYPSQPLRYSLLLNGLSEVSTESYPFADFDGKEVYLNAFQELFGSRNVGKGFGNFFDLFLDPITVDILKTMKLPSDFTGVMLHCNSLLESTSYRKANDLSNYRVRGNEQINAYFYKVLADAFGSYKRAKREGNKTVKVSVPQDALIRALLDSANVDEYSVLNPIFEAEDIGKATFKGLGGRNLDESYGLEIRSFSDSMTGVFGLETPDSSSVGVVRFLTYDPQFLNVRGFLPTEKDPGSMSAVEVMTTSELLSPFTGTHADPPRVGMQSTQAKHIIPTKVQNRPLFGSGVEKTLPHILGSDFVFHAKQDGEVELVDEKNELMVLKYKDGTKDVVDLSPVQAKNSNGGFGAELA